MGSISDLVIGASYDVVHTRKGRFRLRVTSVGDPWVTGVIEKGTAGAMLDYNVREEGEEITIRFSFAAFEPVAGPTVVIP